VKKFTFAQEKKHTILLLMLEDGYQWAFVHHD